MANTYEVSLNWKLKRLEEAASLTISFLEVQERALTGLSEEQGESETTAEVNARRFPLETSGEGAERRPKTVGELTDFPFSTFDELRQAVAHGKAAVGVDYRTAISHLTRLGLICQVLIPAAIVGFVIYTAVARVWLLLFALPLFLAGYLVFHTAGMFFKPLRPILALLSLIGFGWSILTNHPGLTAITAVLLIIWAAFRLTAWSSLGFAARATLENEELLCMGWAEKVVYVRVPGTEDGFDTYWADGRTRGAYRPSYLGGSPLFPPR